MLEALPEAKTFDVSDYLGFKTEVQKAVFNAMLNHKENDYAGVDELAKVDSLSAYSREEIKFAVRYLTGRGFLLEVKKPYGYVYAVNKLKIPNMMINYF